MSIENVRAAKAHTRYKTSDGKQVPGVTTILGVLNKPALVKWANNLGLQGIDSSRYVDKMASIGTLAHYMIQCHLAGEVPDFSAYSPEEIEKANNSLKSYHAWESQHTLKPLLCEAPLISERYRFGGTIDCYCTLNGITTLLDFKTSKAIYPEHIVQVAAYRMLLREHGYPTEVVRVLQIGRDESEGFSERVVIETADHWRVFELCREIYDLKRKVGIA